MNYEQQGRPAERRTIGDAQVSLGATKLYRLYQSQPSTLALTTTELGKRLKVTSASISNWQAELQAAKLIERARWKLK